MTKFRFEIQNCIDVEVESGNIEDARMQIIENMDDYAEQMIDGSCYVSDGIEIDKKEVNEDEKQIKEQKRR